MYTAYRFEGHVHSAASPVTASPIRWLREVRAVRGVRDWRTCWRDPLGQRVGEVVGRASCQARGERTAKATVWRRAGWRRRGGDAQLSRRSMQLHANPSDTYTQTHRADSLSHPRLLLSHILFSSSFDPRNPQPTAPPLSLPPPSLSLAPFLPLSRACVTPPFSPPPSVNDLREVTHQRFPFSRVLFLSPALAASFSLRLRAILPPGSALRSVPFGALQFVYIGAGLLIAIDSCVPSLEFAYANHEPRRRS